MYSKRRQRERVITGNGTKILPGCMHITLLTSSNVILNYGFMAASNMGEHIQKDVME